MCDEVRNQSGVVCVPTCCPIFCDGTGRCDVCFCELALLICMCVSMSAVIGASFCVEQKALLHVAGNYDVLLAS